MSKFAVFHIFDVDGGFGDAIAQKEIICIFDTEEEANAFKAKYEKPHVYDCPYQSLECGILEVMELPTIYNEKSFWWLDCCHYDASKTQTLNSEVKTWSFEYCIVDQFFKLVLKIYTANCKLPYA